MKVLKSLTYGAKIGVYFLTLFSAYSLLNFLIIGYMLIIVRIHELVPSVENYIQYHYMVFFGALGIMALFIWAHAVIAKKFFGKKEDW